MKLVTILVLLLALLIVLKLFIPQISKGMVFIKGKDGIFYKVRKSDDMYETVNTLSIMRNKCFILIKHALETKDSRAERLNNWTGNLEEVIPRYEGEAAYSINKGETIGVCVHTKSGMKEDKNTMFFVIMHELAHVMCKNYAHDDDFWSAFEFLIKIAVENDLYDYEDFDNHSKKYCGHKINFTPYKKND